MSLSIAWEIVLRKTCLPLGNESRAPCRFASLRAASCVGVDHDIDINAWLRFGKISGFVIELCT